MKIETIPGPAFGEVYRIYLKSMESKLDAKMPLCSFWNKILEDQTDISTTFKVMEVNVEEGIAAGIVNPEYIAKQKVDLTGLEFERLYMCKFITPGNQWFKEEWIKTDRYTMGEW